MLICKILKTKEMPHLRIMTLKYQRKVLNYKNCNKKYEMQIKSLLRKRKKYRKQLTNSKIKKIK